MKKELLFSAEEVRAMVPAIYLETLSLQRSEEIKELLPPGQARLQILRSILTEVVRGGFYELSPEEQRAAGI